MTSENVESLLQKIKRLEEENLELKEKLKKYTRPQRNRDYYLRNIDKIREKDRIRKANETPEQKEKRRIYNKQYREKKKIEKQKENSGA